MKRIHWQDTVTLLTGLVLVAALFVLKITPPEGMNFRPVTLNFVVVGIAVVAIAAAALYDHQAWEEWLTLVLGLWMVVSPWILGFKEILVLTWLAILCGAVIAVMALAALLQPRMKDIF